MAEKEVTEPEYEQIIFPGITGTVSMVECPICFSLLQTSRAQEHYNWHVAAYKKVDQAGIFPFGSLFGGRGPL